MGSRRPSPCVDGVHAGCQSNLNPRPHASRHLPWLGWAGLRTAVCGFSCVQNHYGIGFIRAAQKNPHVWCEDKPMYDGGLSVHLLWRGPAFCLWNGHRVLLPYHPSIAYEHVNKRVHAWRSSA
jgi:hypothetical protein